MNTFGKIGSLKIKVLLAFAMTLVAVPAIAQVKKTSFGLGTPRTSGIGGAVRSGGNTCPKMALITPLSGSRTLSSQPTLLWYVEGNNSPLEVTLILRDRDDSKSSRVFSARGEAKSSGLYGFTLPKSAPSLNVGQTQRWDLRVQSSDCSDLNVATAAIQLESNSKVVAAIAKTSSELQRAKIYNEAGYWFDALGAYDRWLKLNPQDQTTKKERNSMIVNGFQDYETLSKTEPNATLDFIKLVPGKIESATATPIVLSELKPN
jgi:Domain of Unknown Function (DUF928)